MTSKSALAALSAIAYGGYMRGLFLLALRLPPRGITSPSNPGIFHITGRPGNITWGLR